MKYRATILVQYDDKNLDRALVRAGELADAMPENLSAAYGDNSLEVIEVKVAEVPS